MIYKTNFNEKTIEYTITFKKGIKNTTLYIKPPGIVNISAPENTNLFTIQDFVERKKGWIYTKLLNHQRLSQIKTNDSEYILPSTSILFKIYSDKDIPSYEQFKASVYFKLCNEIVEERCNHYAKLLGVTINSVKLKAQKTRWGSASTKNNININWLLLLAPADVLDYVIVHEISHFIQMNHSTAFWNIVKKLMPNYAEKDSWLKLNGLKLMRFNTH